MWFERLKAPRKSLLALALLPLLLTGCKTYSDSKGDYSYRPQFNSDTRLSRGYQPNNGPSYYYRHQYSRRHYYSRRHHYSRRHRYH